MLVRAAPLPLCCCLCHLTASTEPPPSFPRAPTAPGRLWPDRPQIIPGVRRPGWWLLPSYTSAPRGRTPFKSLPGATWLPLPAPAAAQRCLSAPLPFLTPLHSLPHDAHSGHAWGPEQRRQVRWSLISSLPLQPCGWLRAAMWQGPTASQGQGEFQAGWRSPGTCEPFSGSGNPCFLLSIR